LLEEHEWKRYATEAANALLNYFGEVKGRTGFLDLVHLDNERIIALMRRLQFREEGPGGVLTDYE
jgi:RimJ/RimL family protein N-acetyltransferase